MISKVFSISVNGLESDIIEIETDINNGLPSFTIVGLPDQSVQESKERLRSAFKSSQTNLPLTKITVNLAPADIRKTGPCFDLPIAVGILLNRGEISNKYIEKSIFIGELSLDGKLRKVSGVLPAVIGAKQAGFKRVFVPKTNAKEASVFPGIDIIAVESLEELIDILNETKTLIIEPQTTISSINEKETHSKYDFKYIIGQNHAKRALQIAAAGGHNIIMSGPPGSGKTMLAKTFATILPEMTIEESIEASKIYSISGLLTPENPIITKRPFRTVHHTASSISIIGGGSSVKPGEISLAHRGVLFFDEVLEFKKEVLEVLRQPLEDGCITVNRIKASYTYPSKFIFVGAMNPCPCGYLTDPDKECICSQRRIENYSSRLSGPLIDRIDLFIEVPKVETAKFGVGKKQELSEDSATIKLRIQKARQIQLARFVGTDHICNSDMGNKEIHLYCKLDENSDMILKQAVNSLGLSARSYFRILKLARTIADLEGCEDINSNHILEALSFRKN